MKPKCLRILIVDDHKLFRKALCVLIKSLKINCDIREACDGQEALEMIAAENHDLILLDVQMPKIGGMEVLKRIRRSGDKTKVIVLTCFQEASLIFYALKIGASGFLFKDSDPGELKIAIIEVISKGQYFAEFILQAVAKQLSSDVHLVNLDITPREFSILLLIRDGHSAKEVARHLGLTLRTIESYKKVLMKKMGSKNMVELVSLAYKTGLLAGSYLQRT